MRWYDVLTCVDSGDVSLFIYQTLEPLKAQIEVAEYQFESSDIQRGILLVIFVIEEYLVKRYKIGWSGAKMAGCACIFLTRFFRWWKKSVKSLPKFKLQINIYLFIFSMRHRERRCSYFW